MLYPYSSISVQTKIAKSGSPCTAFTLDPASCTYLSGDSQDRHDCFVVWDGFVDDPPCTYFRLFAHESTSSDSSGPTFQVLTRKDDDSVDKRSPIDDVNQQPDRSDDSISMMSLALTGVLSVLLLVF